MSINLSCEKCGKLYEMPDSVAGKRARCKQCGHEFRIPMKSGSAQVRPQPAKDLYGLQEAAPLPRSRSYREETEEELAPPPRASYKPKRSSTKSSRSSDIDEDTLRRGVWCLFFGVGIFVLPFFGLQFKIVSFLGELVQFGIGVVLLAIGSVLVIKSGANVVFGVVGLGATGLGALIFLGAIVVHNREGAQGQGPPANVADGGQPPFPAPGRPGPGNPAGPRRRPGPPVTPPVPGQEPVPGFPSADNQPALASNTDASNNGGPAPGAGPRPGFPPEAKTRVVLSNARLTRNAAFGGRQLNLSIDYRFDNGARPFGGRFVLMLESPGSNVKVVIHRLDAQGTISADITSIGPTQPQSFQAYLAIDTPGPPGTRPEPISDKIGVSVTDAPQGATTPPGMAPGIPPGIPPGRPPGLPRPPRMPRPGFGPRRP